MSPFEYLLVLASVILGLAVCELAIGLNRLLRAGSRVRWDWAVPLAIFLVFLKIITQWWAWHAAARLGAGLTFEMFVATLVSATLLFLLAATPVPEAGEGVIDLRAYYAAIMPRFWLLFLLHSLAAMGVALWVLVELAHTRPSFSPLFLVVALPVALIFLRARWAQAMGLVGFSLFYLFQSAGQTLG